MLKVKIKSIRESHAFVVMAFLLFTYLICRAIMVPVVHDEAATFFYYIQSGQFIPFYNAHWDANNHMLNSALSSVIYQILGLSPFALRLPNLMAFPLFAVSFWRLSKTLNLGPKKYLLVAALFFAHYYFDFFALSRGYGLSFAFQMAWLYTGYQYLRKQENHHLWWSVLWASLMLMANLTTVLMVLIWVGLTLLFLLLNKSLTLRKGMAFLGLLPSLLYALVIGVELKERDLLYYGVEGSFWEVSVQVSLEYFLGTRNGAVQVLIGALCLLSFIGFVWQARTFFLSKAKGINRHNILFPSLFIGNILAISLMHYWFGTKYPEDRVALHLYAPLLFSVFMVPKALNKFRNVVLAIWATLLLVNFLANLNLDHTRLWKEEVYPLSVHKRLENFEKEKGRKPVVAGYFLRRLSFAYYNQWLNKGRQNQLEVNIPSLKADFQILPQRFINTEVRQGYDSIAFSYRSKQVVFRRKTLSTHHYLTDLKPIHFSGKDEFVELANTNLDSFVMYQHLNFKLEMSYKLKSKPPFSAWWVIERRDKNDQRINYQFYSFEWNHPHRADSLFSADLRLENLNLKEGDKLVSYLWNKDFQDLEFKNASLTIERLE